MPTSPPAPTKLPCVTFPWSQVGVQPYSTCLSVLWRQFIDVSNRDGYDIYTRVQGGCSPFSHHVPRGPKLREDAWVQNASVSLCGKNVAEQLVPPWACSHTRACSFNTPCELQLLVQLRRGGAPVWSLHVHSKPGCEGWAVILNILLITLRGFL